MQTQAELAMIVKDAYENSDFSGMFPVMEEEYEHISFWVTEVLRGKKRAMEYYSSKAAHIRSDPTAAVTGRLVRILEAPDRVRPHGVYRGGLRMLEDRSFLHRNDAGKIAVLMKQYIDYEKTDVYMLAIPTASENGLLKQVLIANPDFYKWEEL